jgi:hypothetical protein
VLLRSVPDAVTDERVAQLDRALSDDDPDVQRAGVKAAEAALDRERLPDDPYVGLIDRAVTECDVPGRTAAINAYETVAEHRDRLDIDDEFVSDRIRESLTAPDPGQRLSAARIAEEFLPRDDTEESPDVDGPEDPPGEDGPESVEERAETLVEDTSPTDLPGRFERASTNRERAAVVEAARIHLDEFGLAIDEVDALRKTVRTAWDVDATAVRRRVLGAIETGCDSANLRPEFVREILDEGRQDADPQMRVRAIEALGTVVEADVLPWMEVEPWTDEAITDGSLAVRAAALGVLAEAITSGDIGSSRVVRELGRIDGTHPDVVEAGLRCVAVGLVNDMIEWEEVSEFLTEGLGHADPEVAHRAVEAVGAGLEEGTVEWEV